MSMSTDNDEHERTSLLASTTAPPDQSRPRPTLEHPYNPRNPPPPPQEPAAAVNFGVARRPTMTKNTLEEMERSAMRLAGDNIGDSDSVNGLLAGMEASDDEASNFGDKVADDDEQHPRHPVSMKDLDFLATSGARRASSLGMEGADDDKNQRRTNGMRVKARSGKMIDKIGNQLLNAEGNPELEGRILRRSLKISATPEGLDYDDDYDDRAQPYRDQSSHSGGEIESVSILSERVHQSTRALRASVAEVSGGIGSVRKIPSGAKLPTEIEPGEKEELEEEEKVPALTLQVVSMVALTLFVMALLAAALALGTLAVGPPRQPLGEYKILEAQVGEDFWGYYDFYAGKDSAGSNGFINYVSRDVAEREGIAEVVTEAVPKERMIEIYEDGDLGAMEDWLAEDLAFLDQLKRQKDAEENAEEEDEDEGKDESGDQSGTDNSSEDSASTEKKKAPTNQKKQIDTKKEANRRLRDMTSDSPPPKLEPFNPDSNPSGNTTADPTETFVRISSSPTEEGPRNSIRLEGRKRFNRGLFIIDLRHMPAGCGTWPAFWLTDEANWPVNGEIDIVEGVNYQDTAKTALHATRECKMDDVPEGSKTGSWDTAVGIPNGKTGIPDMTFRYAQNCFVYDPHQWINQGCVATDLKLEGRSLGMPLNANGGGVYALEWDPVNTHIRSWVFSPHNRVPSNLREALRTAQEVDVTKRVAPDTNQWGLPYGHFPIGEGTNCPAEHFRNMRLVINLAFCGSVAGNRYFMDCPKSFKKFKTCNEYVSSNPEELKEAYWKIRGVYVYEREWERQWT